MTDAQPEQTSIESLTHEDVVFWKILSSRVSAVHSQSFARNNKGAGVPILQVLKNVYRFAPQHGTLTLHKGTYMYSDCHILKDAKQFVLCI